MSDFNLSAAEFQIASEIRVDAQGKATFSIRGAARLAGVDESAIRSGFKGAELEPSQLARFLISRGFEGAVLEQFGKTGIPDTAVALIIEYYAIWAGRYCAEQAKFALSAFAAIGIRVYSQKLTGWVDNPLVIDPVEEFRQMLQAQLPTIPTKYEPRFNKRFWNALKECYGLDKDKMACGMFIKAWVYGWFPKEVIQRLDELNPLLRDSDEIETIGRNHRHHQHFDDVLLQLLVTHIDNVTLLLETSPNRHVFKRSMQKVRKIKFTSRNVRFLAGRPANLLVELDD